MSNRKERGQRSRMLTDEQARNSLKTLIAAHLKTNPSEADQLLNIIDDPSRQVPIRAFLESIRQNPHLAFTLNELSLIDELLYLYG